MMKHLHRGSISLQYDDRIREQWWCPRPIIDGMDNGVNGQDASWPVRSLKALAAES